MKNASHDALPWALDACPETESTLHRIDTQQVAEAPASRDAGDAPWADRDAIRIAHRSRRLAAVISRKEGLNPQPWGLTGGRAAGEIRHVRSRHSAAMVRAAMWRERAAIGGTIVPVIRIVAMLIPGVVVRDLCRLGRCRLYDPTFA